MRNLLVLIFIFIGVAANTQTLRQFEGTASIYFSSGSGPTYSIRAFYNDQLSYYSSDSAQVGDILYVLNGGACARLRVSVVRSKTGGILDIDVFDIDGAMLARPSGVGGITRETNIKGLPMYMIGISQSLRTCVGSHLAIKSDTLDTSLAIIDSTVIRNDSVFLAVAPSEFYVGPASSSSVGVDSIQYVRDTTSLTPQTGDQFVNSTKDTSGVYASDRWLLSIGGSSGGGLSTIEGALPPYGLITPSGRGGTFVDTVLGDTYIANGTTNLSWEKVGKYITISNVSAITTGRFPIGSRILSVGNDGKGEAVYYSYASIPTGYPVQTVDSRFVFQDASSNYIVYQPDKEGRYNARSLGVIPDWNPSTITGTDNKSAFLDVVQKLDTGGYHIFIPEGIYGWAQATGIQEGDNQSFSDLTISGSSDKTKLYFLNGSRPFELVNTKNVSFKNFYATTYDATGATSKLDLFRCFNVDSIRLENIHLDSMNLLYTDKGKSSTPYWSSGSSSVFVEKCSTNDAENAIVLRYTENVHIVNSTFLNSSGDNIKLNKNTNYVVIEKNTFTSAGDDNVDTYGGGRNITMRDNIFDEGQLEIKAQSKSLTGDNTTVINNFFLSGASINIDGAAYAPLREDLRYSIASDGTITHGLNLPTTDNGYIEVYAFEQGSLGAVTFTTSSITADGFDFTLTSGSYPVTVIVQYAAPAYAATYRDTITLFAGTSTHTITSVPSTAEAEFGDPSIIGYDPTTYTVVNDTVTHSYSTWGDTLTLNWNTPLPGDRWYIVQVGLDGMRGLRVEDNFFQDGTIVANGSIEGTIARNKMEMTSDKTAIQLPYPLQQLNIKDNLIRYPNGLDNNSSAPAISGNSASNLEGIQEEGAQYIFENNKVYNASRFASLNNANLFRGVSFVSKNNLSYKQEDALNLSGTLMITNSVLVDTSYFDTYGNKRILEGNTVLIGNVWNKDTDKVFYIPKSFGQTEVVDMNTYRLELGEVSTNKLFTVDDTDNSIGIGVNPSSSYSLEVGRNAASGYVAVFGRESGGTILTDRRTRMGINGNWDINSVEQSGSSFSVTAASFANAGVGSARYNSTFNIGGTPTSGDSDISKLRVYGTLNRSGDTNGFTSSLTLDNRNDVAANLVALRILADSGEGIRQEGVSVNNLFQGIIDVDGSILMPSGTNPGGGSDTLKSVIDTLWANIYTTASFVTTDGNLIAASMGDAFTEADLLTIVVRTTTSSSQNSTVNLPVPSAVLEFKRAIIYSDDQDNGVTGTFDAEVTGTNLYLGRDAVSTYQMAGGEAIEVICLEVNGGYTWQIASLWKGLSLSHTLTNTTSTVDLERSTRYTFVNSSGATSDALDVSALEAGDEIYVDIHDATVTNQQTLTLSSGTFSWNGDSGLSSLVFNYGDVHLKMVWTGSTMAVYGNKPDRLITVAEVSSTTTAVVGTSLMVNTTGGGVTINPPASPNEGDEFEVIDSRFQAASNNITIDFVTATVNFHGGSRNVVMNSNGDVLRFKYKNSTVGWVKQ